MAGHVVGHLAQRLGEFGIDEFVLVPQHEVLKGIEEVGLDAGDRIVFRKHQRQFLLVHQHTGWNRRDDVVALGDGLLKHRNVGVFHLLDFFQVAELELRHAAAFGVLQNLHRYVVVVQHRDEVFHHLWFVMIAVAGHIDGYFASGALGSCHRFFVTEGGG